MRVVEPILAAHVWCPAEEQEPSGLFNKASCREVPDGWFREEPALAAELYALERRQLGTREPTKCRVCVKDTSGAMHHFDVSSFYELTTRVRPVQP